MNRGRTRIDGGYNSSGSRSSSSGGNSAHRQRRVGADRFSDDFSLGRKDKISHTGSQAAGQMSTGSNSKQFGCMAQPVFRYQQNFPLISARDISSNLGELKLVQDSPEAVGHRSKQLDCLSTSGSKFKDDSPSLYSQSDLVVKHLNVMKTQRGQTSDGGSESHRSSHLVGSSFVEDACMPNESSMLAESGIKDRPFKKETECGQTSHEKTAKTGRSENTDCLPVGVPFDICLERSGTLVRLKRPLLATNREKRNEQKRKGGQNIAMLRDGMVLLKNHISCRDQVKIVKTCREFGMGSGGFYQPGYHDGAKLHLKMMCLGKNWDPETSKYDDLRPIDGAKPPDIPTELHQLVKGAIQDSHAYLQNQSKVRNVEENIPSMSPNICIVNFYASSGRLGLHQDKDESQESIDRGLPVVSFSIGDSAEFLYGDGRDIDKADKVTLESGDVLIFGGKSRNIFHGVTAILPDTAPKAVMEDSNLRPGRLNLTFREY